MSDSVVIGIIGGSGLEDPAIIDKHSIKSIITPFGTTSSDIVTGVISGNPVSIYLVMVKIIQSILPM